MSFRCFAYGSNMFTPKMRAAAPSAKFIAVGSVSRYVFRFNKESDDGSGKGNIVGTGDADDIVWGVIFNIDDRDRAALDASEGGYDSKEIDIVVGGQPQPVLTYIARRDRRNDSLRPYTWYKAFVVRGAQEHNLPPDYIQALEVFDAVADRNAVRERRNAALLE